MCAFKVDYAWEEFKFKLQIWTFKFKLWNISKKKKKIYYTSWIILYIKHILCVCLCYGFKL
jgi:hypothetical protein